MSLYSSGDAASKTEMSSEDNMEDDFDDDENFDMDDEEEDGKYKTITKNIVLEFLYVSTRVYS